MTPPTVTAPDSGPVPAAPAAPAEPGTLMSAVDDMLGATERNAAAELIRSRLNYRELLARNDKPQPGDAERLTFAMIDLRKSTADVRADLAALTERARLAKRIDHLCEGGDVEALQAKAAELSAEQDRLDKQIREMTERRQQANFEAMSTHQAAGLIRDARADLAHFESIHPDLFGGPVDSTRSCQERAG